MILTIEYHFLQLSHFHCLIVPSINRIDQQVYCTNCTQAILKPKKTVTFQGYLKN